MLDALRQVVHLRAYAQKKPIDEYKHEAFAMFERMLSVIREDVTGTLARARFQMTPADLPPMPEFITHHIDPFSGEDDSADIDTGTMIDKAVANGVAYIPGAPFFVDGSGRNTMRLTFAKETDDRMREGVRRLAEVFA